MIQNNHSFTKIIAITGGISTGKSTVKKLLLEKGFPVIDADIIAREVVEVGKPAYEEILTLFGMCILNQDMTINRARLGDLVFNDVKARLQLNDIVHFRVVEEIKKQLKIYTKDNNIVFLDIPLLIEEMDRLKELGLGFDEIWLVYTDKATQLKRLMKRDKVNEESAYKRISAQMSIDDKKKLADVVIDNTRDINELKKNVDKILSNI